MQTSNNIILFNCIQNIMTLLLFQKLADEKEIVITVVEAATVSVIAVLFVAVPAAEVLTAVVPRVPDTAIQALKIFQFRQFIERIFCYWSFVAVLVVV